MKFAYMMKRVNLVVAGNQFLKSEVLPYNSHVIRGWGVLDIGNRGSDERNVI
jgi:hypothetical protein